MNKNEAKAYKWTLTIGDAYFERGAPPVGFTEELLDEMAKRWNTYVELLKFLEKAEYIFNCAILRTPTGEVRNKCTDLNIERMAFIEESGIKTLPVTEAKNEKPK